MKGAAQLLPKCSSRLPWRVKGGGTGGPGQQGSEAASQGQDPAGMGDLGAPSRSGEGVGVQHLRLGIGKGVPSWPNTVVVCLVLRTFPGPRLEWAWPSPQVSLSHQIWVLINQDHCEIK